MLKKIFSIIIMILILVGLSGNVFANDTYTATSTINGVTVNWQYEINDKDQITNLECTNPTDLVGNITVPATLDGKDVISLKFQAFKGATNITGVTLPDSVKEIGYRVFEGCSNLTTVNLNKLESIDGNAFKDCPKLTQITIPKTLTNGNGFQHGPFSGTTKLTSVTFEEGCTTIPEALLEDCTGLTQLTLPNTVSEILEKAFKGCTGITEITLPDSVKAISYRVFEGCSNLLKITILDNCTNMGENIFEDHNQNLTIYCYEDSVAEQYAIDNNIKYAYLTKPTTDGENDKKDEQNQQQKPNNSQGPTKKDDPTTAPGKLPQTGATIIGVFVVLIISTASVIFYTKYRELKEIK